jgi:hypothetical protein
MGWGERGLLMLVCGFMTLSYSPSEVLNVTLLGITLDFGIVMNLVMSERKVLKFTMEIAFYVIA